jgi:hypothetical protein
MSIKITIGDQTINFPSSGTDANWAAAVDDFAIAVADQLAAIASPFDVSPRVQTLSSDSYSQFALPGAAFPDGSVRSFNFNYGIYRTNGTISIAEEGQVNGVYNSSTSSWTLRTEFQGPRQSDGTVYNSFSMSGDQLTLSTVAIGGAYDGTTSKISYFAKTNVVSNL